MRAPGQPFHILPFDHDLVGVYDARRGRERRRRSRDETLRGEERLMSPFVAAPARPRVPAFTPINCLPPVEIPQAHYDLQHAIAGESPALLAARQAD